MIISIDFDGTIIKDNYPNITELLPNVKYVLQYWFNRSHNIIINTCRNLQHAENAKNYLIQEGIPFDYFNENSPKNIERFGSDTRKISCDIQIDDKNLNDVTLKKMIGVDGYNDMLWQTSLEQMELVEKPCIITIVGESGAGKSKAAEYLRQHYDINLIESYTDRPKRTPDEQGHTFLTQTEFTNLQGEQLAYTKFGDFRYCCLVNDLMHCNSYIIDENGLEMLKANWDDQFDIYSLRIHRPMFDRLHSVGDARVSRDEGRYNMKDSQFDFVIHNNDNKIENLYGKLEEFMSVMRLKERSNQYTPFIIE